MRNFTELELRSRELMFSRIAKAKTGINIMVKFSQKIETACTTGKCIYINPGTSEDFKNVPDNKVDLFIAGLFGHELMHCIKTPFEVLKHTEKDYAARKWQFREVFNILEDPAIENFSEYFEGGFLSDGIKYVNDILYSNGPEIETLNTLNKNMEAYQQWKTAMLYYGWKRKIKNFFSNPLAEKVYDDNFNLYNKIINEGDNLKRLSLIKKYYENIRDIFPIEEAPKQERNIGVSSNVNGGSPNGDIPCHSELSEENTNNFRDMLYSANKKIQAEMKEEKEAYGDVKKHIPTDYEKKLYDIYKKRNFKYIQQLESSWKRILMPDNTGKVYAGSGKLNIDRYATKRSRTVNFFEKRKLPEEALDASICIVVDNSGSMTKDIENAMSQVQVLVEALTKTSVDVCVASFNHNVTLLKKWGEKYESFMLDATGGTSTHKALRFAHDTLKWRNSKHKLCICITDGLPTSSDATYYEVDSLRKDADIITVLVGSLSLSEEADEIMEPVFKDWVPSPEVSDLNSAIIPKLRKCLRQWK